MSDEAGVMGNEELPRVRMGGGDGPEVTVPSWWDREETPSPEDWLDWFVLQTRDAQLQIAAFHLALDTAVNGIREALETGRLI